VACETVVAFCTKFLGSGIAGCSEQQISCLPRLARLQCAIKTNQLQLWVLIATAGLLPAALRADGVALSPDGVAWTAAAGGYGRGWGDVGQGLNVPSDGTLYVKYYSETPGAASLYYATHGTEWGSWNKTGPAPSANVGTSPSNPIILKIEHVGTAKSVVTWMNGSGMWRALSAPATYDLALGKDSRWTLPPITIQGPATSKSIWARLFGPQSRTMAEGEVASVPDSGRTGVMLGLALVTLAVVWRVVAKSRTRSRPKNEPKA
jgi:hypothetical protein